METIIKNIDFSYNGMEFKKIPITSYNGGAGWYARIGAVSKVVRQYIKAKYPNAEFQIKSESYSMGNSIKVWINPHSVSKEIYRGISLDLSYHFESGSFNAMEDIYEYKHNTPIKPQYYGNTINFDTKYMMVNYGYKYGSKQYNQYVEGI